MCVKVTQRTGEELNAQEAGAGPPIHHDIILSSGVQRGSITVRL